MVMEFNNGRLVVGPLMDPFPKVEEAMLRLSNEAIRVMEKAYAPYSEYKVGCAGMTTSGLIVSGCNVENAVNGISMCAENGMISELFKLGGGKFIAFACVNEDKDFIMPCGRCRQLISEHAHSALLVATNDGPIEFEKIFPMSWGSGKPAEKLNINKDI